MYCCTTEAQLIEACRTGNRQTFGLLVERYHRLVRSLIYCTTGDLAEADELAKEVFLRAWKSLGQLENPSEFHTWLCRITRHIASRHARKKRFEIINEELPAGPPRTRTADQTRQTPQTIDQRKHAAAWKVLSAIPQQCREPLVLFYQHRRLLRQVATDLQLPQQVVKQRLLRAGKMLTKRTAALIEDVLSRTTDSKSFAASVLAELATIPADDLADREKNKPAGCLGAGSVSFARLVRETTGRIKAPQKTLVADSPGEAGGATARIGRFPSRMNIAVWLAVTSVASVLVALAAAGRIDPSTAASILVVALVGAAAVLVHRKRSSQLLIGFRRLPSKHVRTPLDRVSPTRISKRSIYAGFCGATVAAITWLLSSALLARDWLVAGLIVAAAAASFAVGTQLSLRDRQNSWRILLWDLVALTGLNLVVVNLRWAKWLQAYKAQAASAISGWPSLWVVNFALAMIGATLLTVLLYRHFQSQGQAGSNRTGGCAA